MKQEAILAVARDMLSETGVHPPTLWLEGMRGVVMAPIFCLPREQEGRLELVLEIGEWMATHGELGTLQQVTLIGEAWYWKRPVESEQQTPRAQTPERKEGLLLFELDVTLGTQLTTLYEIRAGSVLRPGPHFQGKATQLALLPALVAAYTRARSGMN